MVGVAATPTVADQKDCHADGHQGGQHDSRYVYGAHRLHGEPPLVSGVLGGLHQTVTDHLEVSIHHDGAVVEHGAELVVVVDGGLLGLGDTLDQFTFGGDPEEPLGGLLVPGTGCRVLEDFLHGTVDLHGGGLVGEPVGVTGDTDVAVLTGDDGTLVGVGPSTGTG